MSKWLEVSICIIITLMLLAITWIAYSEEEKFTKSGETALVTPPTQFIAETRTVKKRFTEEKNTQIWAEMSYTSVNNTVVKFKRTLSDEMVHEFLTNTPVYVEYIPNEFNTERFRGETNKTNIIAIITFIFLVITIYVIKKPEKF